MVSVDVKHHVYLLTLGRLKRRRRKRRRRRSSRRKKNKNKKKRKERKESPKTLYKQIVQSNSDQRGSVWCVHARERPYALQPGCGSEGVPHTVAIVTTPAKSWSDWRWPPFSSPRWRLWWSVSYFCLSESHIADGNSLKWNSLTAFACS